ncbi:MAG TPA: phospholipid carrier-dependent glycosyltransferase [Allocoleopsis sp.]
MISFFRKKKNQYHLFPWLSATLITVFIISLCLRLWGLNELNSLVFDEIYYAKFGVNYLKQEPFFDAHPPLGKYIIAFGIWLGQYFPIHHNTTNQLTGMNLSPFNYRWLNALTGSFIPLIIAGIAFELTKKRSYTIITAIFATIEGFFLVDSRLALINPYLVFFGCLANWFFLLSLNAKKWGNKFILMSIAGCFFGYAISVKWNGLLLLIATYILWFIAEIIPEISWKNIRDNMGRIITQKILPGIMALVIIPLLMYIVIWIPHLLINKVSFWQVHQEMLNYHQTLGGNDIHAYCSPWYSWLIMQRPVGYYYDDSNHIIYDIHLMGNPLLWWLGCLSILTLCLWLLKILIIHKFWPNISLKSSKWVIIYLGINYLTNFLPWMIVKRCTFIYLYMPAWIFVILAFSFLVDYGIKQTESQIKIILFTLIFLVLASFIFWLPIYIALPLSEYDFNLRMLFKTWI